MDINIREGFVLKIEGYQNIDSAVDEAFIDLFTNFFISYYKDPVSSLKILFESYYPIFEGVVIEYLKKSEITSPYHDKLINNLTPIWNRFLNDMRFKDAQQFWNNLLFSIEKLEKLFKVRIHKGSIFYYWGGTAILDGELDKGYLLIHAAYQEDILSEKTPNPNTPAYMFVSLDFIEERQYFGKILDYHAGFLNSFVQTYAKVRNAPYSKDLFQKQFLSTHSSRDTIFLFSYTLARLFHAARVLPQATSALLT